VDGWVEPPAGTGLGVTINEEALARFPYAAAAPRPFTIAPAAPRTTGRRT
jgi:hypothetical protein